MNSTTENIKVYINLNRPQFNNRIVEVEKEYPNGKCRIRFKDEVINWVMIVDKESLVNLQ